MKKINLIVAWFLFLICVANSVMLVSCEKPSDCFETTGNSVSKIYEVSEANQFNTIYVYKGVGLVVKQGTEWKVEVFTGDNLLDNVSVEFRADHSIHLKDNSSCNWTRAYGQIKFYVTTPQLQFLNINSTTEQDIDSEGFLTHNILRLISMDLGVGAGTNDFHMQVNNYQTVIENNNVSRYYLSGQTNEALINLYDGNGRIQAENLLANRIKVFHRGYNDMVVHPIDSIYGKMVSTGNIVLTNTPQKVDVQELYQGKVIYP
jgi:hypothetical protein